MARFSTHKKAKNKIGFSVHKFRAASAKAPLNKNRPKEAMEETLMITSLPALPVPSNELQALLFKYNSLNEPLNLQSENAIDSADFKLKKLKTGRINAFLAYRTFYCKFVLNPDHQRRLSKNLAKIWANEKNQTVWRTYAQAYNLRLDKSTSFVPWLCGRLQIETSFNLSQNEQTLQIHQNSLWSFSTNKPKNVVEDVYLANPQ